MTFTDRDLRRGMDVYSADDVYLGTVVWVRHRRGPEAPARPCTSPPGMAAFSGEALGPMPTTQIGNGGPDSQSPAMAYASGPRFGTPDSALRPTELLVVRMLTSLNWSTFKPRVWRIPVSLVQIASLERVILSSTSADLGA